MCIAGLPAQHALEQPRKPPPATVFIGFEQQASATRGRAFNNAAHFSH